MKRIWLVALSGALATAAMALATNDASAYRRVAGVHAVAYGGVATRGMQRRAYRRTAYGVGAYRVGTYGMTRRAYRRAAYGVGAYGVGAYALGYQGAAVAALDDGNSWGPGAPRVGAAPGNVGYDTIATGSFNGGTYRRNLEMYPPEWRERVARGLARRRIAPEAMAAWANYPTRNEYSRGYVPASYYGPQCHPWLNLACQ